MTLAEFEILASEKLATNDKEARDDFLYLLNAGLLRAVIEALTRSQKELGEVASRSYYHNNGFFKVLLIDKRPKYSIRLHIWPEHPFQDSDVHNHPWGMSGLVLNGSYEWSIYSLERDQEESGCLELYECRYLKDYSGHSFHKKGSVKLIETDTIFLQKSEVFCLPSVQYHSVKKGNAEPADSIVITGHSDYLSADVISSHARPCNTLLKNASVEIPFLREKLVSFIARS